MKYLPIFGLVFVASTQPAFADYTLFNPVPDDKMRPMSTERPSKTDSAVTVDAGHFQIETSLLSYSRNNDCIGGSCTKTRQVTGGATTTLRLGLTQSLDAQVIFDAYRDLDTKDRATGARQSKNGYGDTTLRLKYNIMGNDSGAFAIAALPFVKLATNQDNLGNDDTEGGFEVPFSYTIDENWSIGGMTQFNFLREQADSGYYMGYANSLYVSRTINSAVSSYAEIYTYKPDTSGGQWQNSADFGVVYAVTPSWRVDTGVNIGISNAADDLNFFVGTAYRF
jgi:hypothetical protein